MCFFFLLKNRSVGKLKLAFEKEKEKAKMKVVANSKKRFIQNLDNGRVGALV